MGKQNIPSYFTLLNLLKRRVVQDLPKNKKPGTPRSYFLGGAAILSLLMHLCNGTDTADFRGDDNEHRPSLGSTRASSFTGKNDFPCVVRAIFL